MRMQFFYRLLWLVLWSSAAAFPRKSVAAEPVSFCPKEESSGCPNEQGIETVATPHQVLRQFIAQHQPDVSLFKIHGWRWHTMSLIHEASRLAQALQTRRTTDSLDKAADYVVNFNMRGLHKIQDEVFFPWVRQEIAQRAQSTIAQAFEAVMDELQAQAKQSAALGQTLLKTLDQEQAYITATKLAETTRQMLDTEKTLLIPLVAHYIPTSRQSWLNNRVLANLGVWDSRLHLVGMYEAIAENPTERALFGQEIPYIARQMRTRWKLNLYDPVVAGLDRS